MNYNNDGVFTISFDGFIASIMVTVIFAFLCTVWFCVVVWIYRTLTMAINNIINLFQLLMYFIRFKLNRIRNKNINITQMILLDLDLKQQFDNIYRDLIKDLVELRILINEIQLILKEGKQLTQGVGRGAAPPPSN
jgi:uncharacterized membrane protein YagU involved in acid resistance